MTDPAPTRRRQLAGRLRRMTRRHRAAARVARFPAALDGRADLAGRQPDHAGRALLPGVPPDRFVDRGRPHRLGAARADDVRLGRLRPADRPVATAAGSCSVAQFGLMSASALLVIGAHMDHPPLALIYGAAALNAAFMSISMPTRAAMTPNFVLPTCSRRRPRSTRSCGTARVSIGPALGGLVVAAARRFLGVRHRRGVVRRGHRCSR